MREYQHVIYQNIVKGMQVLINARQILKIDWDDPATEQPANEVSKFYSGPELHTEEFHRYAPVIRDVWKDEGIRKAYNRRREFQIVRIYRMMIGHLRPPKISLSLLFSLFHHVVFVAE